MEYIYILSYPNRLYFISPMIESLQASPLKNKSPDDSSKSNISEEKRQKLREIEV